MAVCTSDLSFIHCVDGYVKNICIVSEQWELCTHLQHNYMLQWKRKGFNKVYHSYPDIWSRSPFLKPSRISLWFDLRVFASLPSHSSIAEHAKMVWAYELDTPVRLKERNECWFLFVFFFSFADQISLSEFMIGAQKDTQIMDLLELDVWARSWFRHNWKKKEWCQRVWQQNQFTTTACVKVPRTACLILLACC